MSQPPESTRDDPTLFQRWQRRMLWTVCITYGTFYFCRTNISAALMAMLWNAKPTSEEEIDADEASALPEEESA